MKYLAIIFTILTLIMQACDSHIPNSDKIALEQVDSLFKTLYPKYEPGAAVLIMKGDSIIFEKGYGIANMDSLTPIDGNTFFNIASVSKQFSAVAIMMLAEEGRLSLDDSVKKWFPQFKADFFNKITIRHLLSHSSGIPDSRDRSDRKFVTTATDVDSYSYLERLDKLNFEPGTSYEYMNPTFQLMYTIIERASGIPFDSFMRERIFLPSGMEESTYFEAEKFIPRMSHGYLYDSLANRFNEFDYGEESFFATKADGGLYTSVREFAEWEKALRTDKLISSKSKNEAHTAKINIPDLPYTSYGYGWFIQNKPDYPVKVYHTGDNGGFQIYAGRFPEKKILYLFFSNRNDRDRELTANKLDQIFETAGWLK